MIYEFFKRLKDGTSDETNGRHIIPVETANACRGIECPRILDVGAGYGADLTSISYLLKRYADLHAIESYPQAIEFLRSKYIQVHPINLECERFPYPDEYFDVVICNQVLEHIKEIFWLVSELVRVTKVRGKIIIGVPNLGSLHNRVLLLFGKQPAAIQVFGPHVRGYTSPGMIDFLERGGFLKVRKVLGANFYPIPRWLSRPLSRQLPSLSVSSFFLVDRVMAGDFLSVFSAAQANELVDTPYFRG